MQNPVDGPIDKLLVRYSGNSVVRALVRLIPFGIGGASDVLVMKRVDEIKEERARAFFDELADGSVELTDDLIQSEDFLHCFFATSNAALKTRRREKIALFARLLKLSLTSDAPANVDEFEELLGALDELSYREWCALLSWIDTPPPLDSGMKITSNGPTSSGVNFALIWKVNSVSTPRKFPLT